MSETKVAVVIPARYASSRFPGKPLALLCGRPMIQHVYEKASRIWFWSRPITRGSRRRSPLSAAGR